jgi:hypothetical protein
MTAREKLIEIYLEYLNNYLTPVVWAEHNGLTEAESEVLIGLARQVFHSKHPES